MKPKNQTSSTRGNSEAKSKLSGAFKNKGMKPAPTSGGAKYTNKGK